MGFGGINVHVALESAPGAEPPDPPVPALDTWTRRLIASAQDCELLLLGAADAAALRSQVERLARRAPRIAYAEIGDLSAELAGVLDARRWRAALVVRSPLGLVDQLSTLRDWLDGSLVEADGFRVDLARGLFLGWRETPARIGLLFPGQGSPVPRDGGALARRFPAECALLAALASRDPARGGTHFPTTDATAIDATAIDATGIGATAIDATAIDAIPTEIAQPTIVAASLATLRVLERAGLSGPTDGCVEDPTLEGTLATGHSLGEISALAWAGALDDAHAVQLAAARGQAMRRDVQGDPGAMAAVLASPAQVEPLIAGSEVCIAGYNGPLNTVVSGPTHAIDVLLPRARAAGYRVRRLGVSHAFHSPLVAPAAESLVGMLESLPWRPLARRIVSTVTGAALPVGSEAGALRALLHQQVCASVRFEQAIEHVARDCQLLIEVGPGAVLTGLVGSMVQGPCLATDGGGTSLAGVFAAVAAAYVAGAARTPEQLLAGRFTRPFDLEHEPTFLANPCEEAPLPEDDMAISLAAGRTLHGRGPRAGDPPSAHGRPIATDVEGDGSARVRAPGVVFEAGVADPLSVVRRLVAVRTELPDSAIDPDQRLLDDLHLNSIAVGQLVGEACRALGLPPPVAPHQYAEATVSELARALGDLVVQFSVVRAGAHATRSGGLDLAISGATVEAFEPRHPAGVDSWVRCFRVTRRAHTVASVRDARPVTAVTANDLPWQLVIPGAEPSVEAPSANALSANALSAAALSAIALSTRAVPPWAQDLQRRLSQRYPEGGCLLACTEESVGHGLDAMVGQFHRLARQRTPAALVLVEPVRGPGLVGLARTLVHEWPGTVCVLRCAPGLALDAARLSDAVELSGGYQERWLEADGRVSEPVLTPFFPQSPPPPFPASASPPGSTFVRCARSAPDPVGSAPTTPPAGAAQWALHAGDVLLVTGGGKGIAAECALALARAHPLRVLLIGRSDPAHDSELARNLARFQDAGLEQRYLALDLTNSNALGAALHALPADWCNITALLHGAGRNEPCLLRDLDASAVRATLAPKVDGLAHLLAALDPRRLRLLVTFGSVIAHAGLRGEGDYGLANDWLAEATEEHGRGHPHCRCLCLEWSVWSGAGMGERLGRVEILQAEGITPIPIEEGVLQLERILADPAVAGRVVVCGRLGHAPTVRFDGPELPLARFLEHPRVHVPGVEVVADSRLSSETDPYLDDHVFHGERVLPGVLGLEAMAQAASALVPAPVVPIELRAVAFERPIVVPAGGSETVRVAALRRADGAVDVVLRCSSTRYVVDHQRATILFGAVDAQVSDVAHRHDGESRSEHAGDEIAIPVALHPARDLYGGLLFQGGRFQRLAEYRRLGARVCEARIEHGSGAPWFQSYLPATLVLGDPAQRDATLHAIQPCVPEATLLPTAVERLLVRGPVLAPTSSTDPAVGSVWVHARERAREGPRFTYDVEVVDVQGHVLERWEGLRLVQVQGAGRRGPWVSALVGPYLERRVGDLIESPGLRIGLVPGGRAATSGVAANGSEPTVGARLASLTRRPDGKPAPHGSRQLSLAHSGALTLAVLHESVSGDAARGPVTCDLEAVRERGAESWRDLLGPHRELATVLGRETGESPGQAGTRVWCARECLTKAGCAIDTPLTLERCDPDGWVMFGAGSLRIATVALVVRDPLTPLIAAILGAPRAAPRVASVPGARA